MNAHLDPLISGILNSVLPQPNPMRHIRVELRLSVLVHVGDDITEDSIPNRDPDATECVKLVRVAYLGEQVQSRDVAAEVLANMTTGSAPVMADAIKELEELRAQLAEIGEVYRFPDKWDHAGQGGPPPIEAFEKIDLSDL